MRRRPGRTCDAAPDGHARIALTRDVPPSDDGHSQLSQSRQRCPYPPDVLTSGEWEALLRALRLSAREAELLRCICHDDGTDDIAERLRLSRHTIHTYRERLYRKLGVNSASQVVAVAFSVHVVSAGLKLHIIAG